VLAKSYTALQHFGVVPTSMQEAMLP